MSRPAELQYECVFKLPKLHTSWVSDLAFSTAGTLLASASADGTLFIIDVLSQSALLAVDFEHPIHPTCVIWIDSQELAVGRSDGGVQFFHINQAKRSVHITQALETMPMKPIDHIAYDPGRSLLAVAFLSCVQIYKKVNYAGNLVWEEEDEITTDISDAGLVTALEFIQHPTLTLLIAHAQAGFTMWKSQGLKERQSYDPIGGAHVLDDKSVLLLNLTGRLDVAELLPQTPWLKTKDHFQLQGNDNMNYRLPVRALSGSIAVTGSATGVIHLVQLRRRQHTTVTHHGSTVICALATFGTIIATGTGDPGEPGIIRVFSTEKKDWPQVPPKKQQGTPLFYHMNLHTAYLRHKSARRLEAAVRIYWKQAIFAAIFFAAISILMFPGQTPGNLSAVVQGWWGALAEVFAHYGYRWPKAFARRTGLKAARHVARLLE